MKLMLPFPGKALIKRILESSRLQPSSIQEVKKKKNKQTTSCGGIDVGSQGNDVVTKHQYRISS